VRALLGARQNKWNRLSTLTPPSAFTAGSFGFTYDALSRRTQMTRPNGVTTNYTYDNLSRLLSVLHQLSGSTIDGATYTVDNAGNRTSKTDWQAGVTSNYSYDAIYQLTQVLQGANTTESYSYDPVGNRLSSLGVSPYNYNSSNELASTPSATYGYDLNGNAVTKNDSTGITTYAWDFENRLTSVTLPGSGGIVSFKYDPFGRRIYKSSSTATSIYAYDGDNLVEEGNSSGATVARYTQGENVDEPLAMLRGGAISFYNPDALGSITSLSDSAGAIAQTYMFDSFGKLTASSGSVTNPFQYVSRELDTESNLYYVRARYFDPTAGRFLSEDPIGFNGDGNFYRYVDNDPADQSDPFGLCAPGPAMKKCLQKIFDKSAADVDAVKIQLKKPNPKWDATTRRNKIILYIPCDQFFSDNDTILEEYYHVFEQWNTGRMNRRNYVWNDLHGHDRNKFEVEAGDFARKHASELEQCLKCTTRPQ
jgi:RHS repeat-associated protein